MAKQTTPPPPTRVTRDDLEQRFRQLQEGCASRSTTAGTRFLTAGGIGALLVVLIIFLLGRRSGKKKTTYVEIRRV